MAKGDALMPSGCDGGWRLVEVVLASDINDGGRRQRYVVMRRLEKK